MFSVCVDVSPFVPVFVVLSGLLISNSVSCVDPMVNFLFVSMFFLTYSSFFPTKAFSTDGGPDSFSCIDGT